MREEFRNLLPDDYQGDFATIPLAELGVDSLDFFEAIIVLEEDHGIIIPITELHSTITLNDILERFYTKE